MNTFTPERISQTLDVFRAFLRGETRGPLLTVHAAPDYRQEPDPEVIVERACAQIRADAASDEPHVLPTFWADFGTVSTARLWGGRLMPARDGGGVHIAPVAPALRDLAALTVQQSYEASDYGRAAALYRRVCERLGTGDVFVRTPDFQGPMNTLALRIADAFGGVYIHCCGAFTQHLPALAAAEFKIWGIEVHYPCTKLWDVYAALGDRVVYTPYVTNTGAAEFPTLVEFCRDLAVRACAQARYWLCVCPGSCDVAELRRVLGGGLGCLAPVA